MARAFAPAWLVEFDRIKVGDTHFDPGARRAVARPDAQAVAVSDIAHNAGKLCASQRRQVSGAGICGRWARPERERRSDHKRRQNPHFDPPLPAEPPIRELAVCIAWFAFANILHSIPALGVTLSYRARCRTEAARRCALRAHQRQLIEPAVAAPLLDAVLALASRFAAQPRNRVCSAAATFLDSIDCVVQERTVEQGDVA